MKIELTYPDYKDPAFKPMVEQTEYLLGVLYADKEHRLDMDLTRDIGSEIDPYGTGSQHFWRGVVDTGGYIAVEGAGRYEYPQFELKGGYRFLRKFLDFCEETLAPRSLGSQFKWDADGKLEFQAMGNFISLGGGRAQEVVRLLYVGAVISRDTFRQRANRIVQWLPKR
jgi:hypothetical protein